MKSAVVTAPRKERGGERERCTVYSREGNRPSLYPRSEADSNAVNILSDDVDIRQWLLAVGLESYNTVE